MEYLKEAQSYVKGRLSRPLNPKFPQRKTKLSGKELKGEMASTYLVGLLAGIEHVLVAIERPEHSKVGKIETKEDVIADIHLRLLDVVEDINKQANVKHKVTLEDLIQRTVDSGCCA